MYCNLVDLKMKVDENALIYLTDDEGTGAVNIGRIDQACKDAQVEIDPYALKRYKTPFNPVPEAIKRVAMDIAIYNLYCRKGLSDSPNDKVIKDRYDSAVKWLEKLAAGKVTLGEEEPAAPSPSGSLLEIQSNTRLMSRNSLRGM